MIVPATAENVARAAQALAAGELVAFPTETVYGLGANARAAAAVDRLFAAKGRPAEHPVIVHLADAASLPRWARTIPAGAAALAGAFWPGPLTLVLPRADGVLDSLTGGQASVGLRVPAQPIAHALLLQLAALGCDGIAAPSANRFGRISATAARHVAEEFGDAVALILDGGPSHHGIESTIVDFSSGDPVVLRPGSITTGELARVLGAAPRSAGAGATRASGSLASHYAPRTLAKLLPRNELLAAIAGLGGANAHISVLAHSVAQPPEFEGAWFDAPGESARYAQQLYANLRALDAREADEIWIEAPPDGPDWVAIGDRLRRATHRD
jgi:L-threonylcarbamoyladenylate synthase